MAKKVKGQRLDNGEYQGFYDADAVHNGDDIVVTGEDQKHYKLSVDSSGSVVPVEQEEPYHIVKSGLEHRWLLRGDKIIDVETGDESSDIVISNGTFIFSKKASVKGIFNAESGTIEFVCSRKERPTNLFTAFLTTSNVSNAYIGAKCGLTSEKTIQIYWSPDYSKFSDSLGRGTYKPLYDPSAVPVLNKFRYGYDPESRKPCTDDRYTYSLCFDLTADAINNKKCAINGLVAYNSNEAYNFSSDTGVTVTGNVETPYYEIRVYNRVLSDDELVENSIFDRTHYSVLGKNVVSVKCKDGYKDFGANPALKSVNQYTPNIPLNTPREAGTYIDESGNEYTISSLTPYTEPERTDNNIFEGVKFVTPPSTLYTFRKYSVFAMPYPYNGEMVGADAGQYHILYSSSDESVCACVNGVLIPKQPGEVTITARLSGTQFTDSFVATVEVYDNTVLNVDTVFVPENYSVGIHSLDSQNPKSVALAMFSAIKAAGENGFHRVVFPKKTYNIYPVFEYGSGKTCLQMPSNLEVDFNDSEIFIAESPNSFGGKTSGYTLFGFRNGCKNSIIKNATFFGERYNNTTHAESEYCQFCSIFSMISAKNCGIENVKFNSCVGFQLSFSVGNMYDHWSGTRDPNYTENSGLPNRGYIQKNELEFGDYDANGNPIESSNHIRTKVAMHIGHTEEELARYQISFTAHAYYLIDSRWITVWWYDKNMSLLNPGGTTCFQYAGYDLPENAEYFKLSAYGNSLPEKNVGDYPASGVLRIFPYIHAEYCWAKNIVSINPHAWSLTVTGGQNNYFGDMVLGMTKLYAYWAIDLEDDYWTSFCNVFDSIVSGGTRIMGGNANATVSMFDQHLGIEAENENFRAINCTVNILDKSSKSDCVYRGIKAKTVTVKNIRGRVTETDNFEIDFSEY